MRAIKDRMKEAFKLYFKPITCIFSSLSSPSTLFKKKDDGTYWTVAPEYKFFEYNDIFSIYIYQKIEKNWYGKWIRNDDFITLTGEERFHLSKEMFEKLKGRCS